MTYSEFQNLLLLADRMIASCAPRKAEYGRGYHSGIQFHFNNGQPDQSPIITPSRISPVETAAAMFMLTLAGIVMAARG